MAMTAPLRRMTVVLALAAQCLHMICLKFIERILVEHVPGVKRVQPAMLEVIAPASKSDVWRLSGCEASRINVNMQKVVVNHN